ncbi:hypothetical protein JAAARDRAFT_32495 [Jaapia argillacea MUCL 33604]|uniref:Metallo-beta-lactamase domain-containing protein n=1 Tax=Jaapia argillacea MUCL 33604 TaxID=933084 RepID=A0A067Q9E1_9AGAM|nr:hypothetical protein JAAARDRAFT_32495 [Jaapia argillacea MUCL 33604]
MSTTVIREVAKDVWIFSCPFARFGVIPFGGRSTAIKLSNGDVWLLASTPADTQTKEKLNELGPVKYIVGADAVHHLYLGDYKKAYPEAKLISVDEAIAKKKEEGLKFDGSFDSQDKFGFEDDIKHCYFSGYKNKDVAFFHPASKSMIEADLLLNLPAKEQYSKTGSSGAIPIIDSFSPFSWAQMNPYSWAHKKFAWSLGVDKEAMKRDVKTVAGWDFERIIPCHGDVIETDAKKAWEAVYQYYI